MAAGLARQVASGSGAHAWLLLGPSGSGKLVAATAMAAALNCRVEPRVGCGSCSSCARVLRHRHPDVHHVVPEGPLIPVDVIREQVVPEAARSPFEGLVKVFVVQEAERMNPPAQNALLKTLEEPPPASTFVLITVRPDVLLPTVRSRCQRLRFGRLAPGDVAAVLRRDHGFADDAAHAVGALADGSVGQALAGETEAYTEARQKALTLLRMAASSADPRRRLAAAKVFGGDWGGKVEREELARRLRLLSSMLRDLGLLGSRVDEKAMANVDEAANLRGLLASFDRDRTIRAFLAADQALAALDRNASPRIVADWLALQV